MDPIKTSSTSAASADADPIELRVGATSRLVFKPVIVHNYKDPDAAVDGCFIWQRKGRNDAWEDVRGLSLNSLKKGEGYALKLHAAEILKFHRGLGDLFAIHRSHGVPIGDRSFVAVEETLERLLGLDDDQLAELPASSLRVLGRLLRWAATQPDMREVLAELEGLHPDVIRRVSALAGVSALRAAVAVWKQDAGNADESFWQRTLVQHPVLLEQLFAYPVVILKDRAYVGGKSVENTGGNIADFLLKNMLTHNAALVEIKTPSTPLLGPLYRNRTYNIHTETTGAVMQALANRASLAREIDNLRRGLSAPLDTSAPGCLVIVGSTNQLDAPEKRQAFELFRGELQGVQLVTFDELFMRTSRLVMLLAPDGTSEADAAPPAEEAPDDDIPF